MYGGGGYGGGGYGAPPFGGGGYGMPPPGGGYGGPPPMGGGPPRREQPAYDSAQDQDRISRTIHVAGIRGLKGQPGINPGKGDAG